MRCAIAAARVDGAPLLIDTRKADGCAGWRTIWRIPKVRLGPSQHVVVRDVIQMDAMRPVVVHGQYRVLCQFAFGGQAPHLCLCRLDVLIDMSWTARWQRHLHPCCSREGTKVVYGDLARIGSRQLHAGVVRLILYHVKCYVAEVALVADSVPAANARLAISSEGVSETHARPQVPVSWFPEFPDRAVWGKLHLRIPQLFEQVCPAAEVKIGIELRIAIVLHAVIFIPQAVIQREPRREPPAILCIERKIPVAVAPRKRRRIDR